MRSRRTHENEQAKVADWKLERFLLGELPPDEMERLGRSIGADESLRQRLESLGESNRELLERFPAGRMAQQIQDRLERATASGDEVAQRGWISRWMERIGSSPERPLRVNPAHALPMIAALATLLVLPLVIGPEDESTHGLLPTPGQQTTSGDGINIKGPPQLHLHRKTTTGSEPLESGDTAREHDLILVQYVASGRQYGAIVSIDGRGTLTQHLPASGHRAAALEQGETISLPFSYELDDAPHRETFYFITSDAPFDVQPIVEENMASLSSTAPDLGSALGSAPPESLTLPDDLDQVTFTLVKDSNDE